MSYTSLDNARIAVRSDGTLILGVNNGAFTPGHVYQVDRVGEEFILRDLGVSAATQVENLSLPASEVTWGRDASALIRDGRHLFTWEEMQDWMQAQDIVSELRTRPRDAVVKDFLAWPVKTLVLNLAWALLVGGDLTYEAETFRQGFPSFEP